MAEETKPEEVKSFEQAYSELKTRLASGASTTRQVNAWAMMGETPPGYTKEQWDASLEAEKAPAKPEETKPAIEGTEEISTEV